MKSKFREVREKLESITEGMTKIKCEFFLDCFTDVIAEHFEGFGEMSTAKFKEEIKKIHLKKASLPRYKGKINITEDGTVYVHDKAMK